MLFIFFLPTQQLPPPKEPLIPGGGHRQLSGVPTAQKTGFPAPGALCLWCPGLPGRDLSKPQLSTSLLPRIHLGTARGACPTCLCRHPHSEGTVLPTRHLGQGVGAKNNFRARIQPWPTRSLWASLVAWSLCCFLICGKEQRHNNTGGASLPPCQGCLRIQTVLEGTLETARTLQMCVLLCLVASVPRQRQPL